MKKDHYLKIILESKHKTESIWNIVKRKIQGSVSCDLENLTMISDGKIMSNPEKVANVFNTFFMDTPKNMCTNTKPPRFSICNFNTPEI